MTENTPPKPGVEAVLLVTGTAAIVGGLAVLSWPVAIVTVGVLLVAMAVDLRR